MVNIFLIIWSILSWQYGLYFLNNIIKRYCRLSRQHVKTKICFDNIVLTCEGLDKFMWVMWIRALNLLHAFVSVKTMCLDRRCVKTTTCLYSMSLTIWQYSELCEFVTWIRYLSCVSSLHEFAFTVCLWLYMTMLSWNV